MENIKLEDLPARPEADQAAFFEACHANATRALAQKEPVSVKLKIAGGLIQIDFAGPALAEVMLGALAHLIVDTPATPDVRLIAYDAGSTGVGVPEMPVGRNCLTDRGDLWSFNSTRYRSAFHWLESSVTVMDVETGRAVFWVNQQSDLPYWTKASPFRTVFHWWMMERGAQLIHAAGVGYEDGAVLITGKGGVGKSTIALAAIEHGMQYVADDYLVVSLDNGPEIHSLYNTAKLNPDQVERFPRLADLIQSPPKDGDKAVISLHPERTHQISGTLPVKAFLSPSFADSSETSFDGISAADLFAAASFTTLSQLPHAGEQTATFINRLISACRTFRIKLGRDVPSVPVAIESLLKQPEKALWAQSEETELTTEVSELPLISVIMPVYNGAHFVPEAVQSILDQGYPNLEIIIVDDGSEDNIADVVDALPTDVRFFRQDNNGPSSARNRGIRDASGEFIAFLDADDLWPADRLNNLARRLMDNPDLQIVQGAAQLMRRDTEDSSFKQIGNPAEAFPHYIGAGLSRKSIWELNGLFDEDMTFGEDTDWYNRVEEKKLAIERLEQVTLLVRRHETNMTRGKSPKDLAMLHIFRKQLKRARAGEHDLLVGKRAVVENKALEGDDVSTNDG